MATIRRKEKITQKQIAKRIGVSQVTIGLFETYNRGMNYQLILKYIKALGYKIVLVKNVYVERDENDLDPL